MGNNNDNNDIIFTEGFEDLFEEIDSSSKKNESEKPVVKTKYIEKFLSNELSKMMIRIEDIAFEIEEEKGDVSSLTNELFRILHTLKGTSSTVGLSYFSKVIHNIESTLESYKSGKYRFTAQAAEIIFAIKNFLEEAYNDISAENYYNEYEEFQTKFLATSEELKRISNINIEKNSAQNQIKENSKNSRHDIMMVSYSTLEKLSKLTSELLITLNVVKNSHMKGEYETKVFSDNLLFSTKLISDVQTNVIDLQLETLDGLFRALKRSVKDAARTLNKKVNVITAGSDLKLDHKIVEDLKEALIHVVRNAVDHGIESEKERIKKEKPLEATISLSASYFGSKLVIKIVDDGGGIDVSAVKKKCLSKNLISPNSQLSDDQIIQFIFDPGFSTKETVSELSGRGVGLDVVKQVVTKNDGQVHVETNPGKGTAFVVSIPVNTAVFDVLKIKIDDESYIVPFHDVQEIITPSNYDLEDHHNFMKRFLFRGEVALLTDLGYVMTPDKLTSGKANLKRATALMVKSQDKFFGFFIDEVMDIEKVKLTRFKSDIDKVQGISGSAILSSGIPSIVLNLKEIADNLLDQSYKKVS